uniref:Uncharacterized protein n=1 Tax=Tanacetum cinerariifolium TaxID=118510 RepID=A0A6L2KY53_TANCI|nr:hypothetical protein [Tanacetum cinerariifolium]
MDLTESERLKRIINHFYEAYSKLNDVISYEVGRSDGLIQVHEEKQTEIGLLRAEAQTKQERINQKNGEAIVETRYAPRDGDFDPILQVYDPCSGRVTDVGLPWSGSNDFENSTVSRLSMNSYMETLLLLGQ